VKSLLVVYHSLTGGTRQMVDALASGAADFGEATTRVLHATDAGPEDVLAHDAYVFATPENLAAISGLMKDFFDRCYYPVLGRVEGRPYAAMVCAGSDGSNALRQMERIVTGWRLRAVAEPIIVYTRAQTPEQILAAKSLTETDLERCRQLGASLAAGRALGIF
jgi:multimeric flavodoxin WrbA